MTRRQKDRSWMKTAVRKLRDWLNGFLQEGRDAADLESEDQVGELASDAEERIDPSKLFEVPGAPEEWLKVVREGAPGLLLGTEESGAIWQGVPKDAMRSELPASGGEHSEEKTPSVADSFLPAFSSQPMPTQPYLTAGSQKISAEPPANMLPDTKAAKPDQPTLVQRLIRRLTPKVSRSEMKNVASEPRLPHELVGRRSSNSSLDSRLSVEPARVTPIKSKFPLAQASVPTGSIKRSAEKPLPVPSTNRRATEPALLPGSLGRGSQPSRKTTNPISSKTSQIDAARRANEDTERIVSSSVAKPRVEEISVARLRHNGNFALPARGGEAKLSWPNPLMSRDRSSPATNAGKSIAATRLDLLETRPAANRWPLIPFLNHVQKDVDTSAVDKWGGPEQEMYRDDPWPDLPDNQPAAMEYTQDLRRRHLRALELEQRGGS